MLNKVSSKGKWTILAFLLLFGLISAVRAPRVQAANISAPTRSYLVPPFAYCADPGPHTYFDVWSPDAHSNILQGTTDIKMTLMAGVHICNGTSYDIATNVRIQFSDYDRRLSGLGGNSELYFGTERKVNGNHFVHKGYIYTQSVNITVNTSGLGPGRHELCYTWTGIGQFSEFGPGSWSEIRGGPLRYCASVTVAAKPMIRQGGLEVRKYPQSPARNRDIDICVSLPVDLCLNNMYGDSYPDIEFSYFPLNMPSGQSSTTTSVRGDPKPGYKIDKIRVNRYGPGCSPCTNEHRDVESVSDITVHAEGITYVDFFYSPDTGTLAVIKYPERGASTTDLTAKAKRGDGTLLFDLYANQGASSRSNLTAGKQYVVEFTPQPGFRVSRVRINRSDGTTVCNNCTMINGNQQLRNVEVSGGLTTWVDVFYEPNILGYVDGACPRNSDNNGKITGWAIDYQNPQDMKKQDTTPSRVKITIFGVLPKEDLGNPISVTNPGGIGIATYEVTANASRPDLPEADYSPKIGQYHGIDFDVPSGYFNGKNYTVTIYPLRDGNTVGSGSNIFRLRNANLDPERYNINMSCPPPVPVGEARCLVKGGNGYLQGWGFDPRRPEGPVQVKARYEGGLVFDIYGNDKARVDVEIDRLKKEGHRGVDPNGLYAFNKIPIPDRFHDGKEHRVRIFIITANGEEQELAYRGADDNLQSPGTPIVIGPNAKCDGEGEGDSTLDKWLWPWLKTENGNVVSRGKITGQLTDLPGSRLDTATQKEAEYLVMSVAGGGNPFCSSSGYILTNINALQGDCNNGDGYKTLNLYNLDTDNNDKIFKGLEDAFKANGEGRPGENNKCKPYNTVLLAPIQLTELSTGGFGAGSSTCEEGTVLKLEGSDRTLNAISLLSGRNTAFIDAGGGGLKVKGNIVTGSDIPLTNPKLYPSLAIVVKGDVYIDRTVGQLDASIYATGKIYTCHDGTNPIPIEQCNTQLTINGALLGKGGYDFRRIYTEAITNSNDNINRPAESISMTGQLIAFPPPGLTSLYFADFASSGSIEIDTGEYLPKF